MTVPSIIQARSFEVEPDWIAIALDITRLMGLLITGPVVGGYEYSV
jgi:hypothetical protein